MNLDLGINVKSIGDNFISLVDDLKLKELGKSCNCWPMWRKASEFFVNIDEKQKAIMQWLSPVDPWENHEAARNAHQSGTSNWLMESKEFTEWHQSESSFLLLTGFRTYSSSVLWP
jgi:hypothetical protein